MILVDSSVWIDFFKGRQSGQTERLDSLLDSSELAIGDLIFTEVLQGCRIEKEFNQVRHLLGRLKLVVLGGADIAVSAAKNYVKLRQIGVTVRGTIDVIIATRCLADGVQLLHSDKDFDAFEAHLGLQVVKCAT